ncbi:MAG TPA: glycosyltransferase [Bacteroidia bacterium]|jgi:glycosyltransferase involved in cell wall biosynthesis|nr:glycosyltransferase [Bacteroidia bacterium]
MGKKFVTLFPICENVHLTKDLGQIPFFLQQVNKYNSSIVSYNNSKEYSNLNGEVKGLKMEFIENTGRFSFLEKGVLKYIRENAKKIDVLNLYIFSKFTFIYGIMYKRYNPKGFLFLKLDGYNETFEEGRKIRHSANKFKNFILKYTEKKFLEKVDLITIENSFGEELVKKKYPHIAHKIMYLPVGVNDHFLFQNFQSSFKSFAQKENIILTTGRIGEEIKNNEMMLRALSQTELKDWKMIFVGPVNPKFKLFYEEWVKDYPHLKEKIIFTGEIQNRAELYEWYNRAKIFCMTSRIESFCHSIGEALYFGNYIIGTEGIVSMPDLTNKGKYGTILKANDHETMAKKLQELMDSPDYLSKIYPEIVSYSHKNFVWSKIVEKIYSRIENR